LINDLVTLHCTAFLDKLSNIDSLGKLWTKCVSHASTN